MQLEWNWISLELAKMFVFWSQGLIYLLLILNEGGPGSYLNRFLGSLVLD